mgnify:CR=1 FL=1
MAVSAAAADYDWANTQIEFNLNARQLELLIADGKNDYNLFIDGKLDRIISTTTSQSYAVSLSQGAHRVLLTKRTGPNFGAGQFKGIRLPQGGELLALPVRDAGVGLDVALVQFAVSMQGLVQRHPQLRLALEVSDRLVDMARDGIDIAIRTSVNLPETAVARRIGTLGRALYATPGYLASAGTPTHPDDLRQHRLITNSAVTQLNHWPFLSDGKRTVVVADGQLRANDTNMVASMTLEGLGIARLSTISAVPLVRQKRLVPVLADHIDPQPMPIYVVTAGARHRLPKIKACIDYWADWFKRHGNA